MVRQERSTSEEGEEEARGKEAVELAEARREKAQVSADTCMGVWCLADALFGMAGGGGGRGVNGRAAGEESVRVYADSGTIMVVMGAKI